VLPHLN